jgi:hypothetical protein
MRAHETRHLTAFIHFLHSYEDGCEKHDHDHLRN